MKVYRILYEGDFVVDIQEYDSTDEAVQASKAKPHSSGRSEMRKAANLDALRSVSTFLRLYVAEEKLKRLLEASAKVELGPVGPEEVEASKETKKKDPKKFWPNGRPKSS
jgi:hypothetical protein